MAGMYPPAKGETTPRDASTGYMDTLMQEARDTSTQALEPGNEHRMFYNLPSWKRIIIMLGGPTMNLLIGLLLYTIVLCGFGVVQTTTTVGSVSECVLPATSDRQTCETGDTTAPGAAAGLKPGDVLLSINGTPIQEWTDATAIIRDSAGEPLSIVVDRDGSEQTLEAEPILTERYVVGDDGKVVENAKGELVTEEVGFLGIGSATAAVQQPITAVLPAVGDNIVRVGHLILNLPQRLVDVVAAAFGPGDRDPNGPISVVGVGRIAGEITSLNTIPVETRVSALLGVLASLNVALFVFNLIPLLPLDGGHVAGALWDALRRFIARVFKRPEPRPVDIARLIPLTVAVSILLGAMSLLLIYADIVKPISVL